MLNPLIKQVPVVGQAYGFTKTAMKDFVFYKSFINLNFLSFILSYFRVPVYKLPKLNLFSF